MITLDNATSSTDTIVADATIEQIKQFLYVAEWPARRLARAAGISPAALSQFLSGQYKGDNAVVIQKVYSVIDREKEKLSLVKINHDFIETTASKRFFDVANVCRLQCELGVVFADAGIGKTEAAREFASKRPDVILIEVNTAYTASVFFRKLIDKLGSGGNKRDLDTIFEDCVSRLKKTGRLIIVDEAEHLPYRALELLRALWDQSKTGILLSGMPKLLANLRGYRGEYAQLFGRVGIASRLVPLTDQDIKNIVQRQLNNPKDADLWKIFKKESAGNTRRLFKLLRRAIYLADINDGIDITTEVVIEASTMLKIEVMS